MGIQAQENFELKYYSHKDGLSHRFATDVIRGVSGRLWIGTRQGLNYYDGNQIRKFSPNWELSEEYFYGVALYRDHANNIWAVSAHSNTPAYMVEDSSGNFPLTLQLKDCLGETYSTFDKSLSTSVFFKTKNGLSFIKKAGFTKDKICYEITRDDIYYVINRHYQNQINLKDYNLLGFVEDSKTNIWAWMFGTGFIRYDPIKDSLQLLTELPISGWKPHPTLPFPIDANYKFWYPNYTGHSDSLFQSFLLPEVFWKSSTMRYFIDNNKNIWIFEKGSCLARFDITTKRLSLFEVKIPSLTSVHEDEEGVVWMGSEVSLYKLTPQKRLFKNIGSIPFRSGEFAPIGVSVRSMVEAHDGTVFLHLDNGSLFKASPGQTELTYVDLTINGRKVYSYIYEIHTQKDHSGKKNMWIASNAGLIKYDFVSGEFEHIQPDIISTPILRIKQGNDANTLLLWTNKFEFLFWDISKEAVINKYKAPEEVKGLLAYDAPISLVTIKAGVASYDFERKELQPILKLSRAEDIGFGDVRSVVVTDTMYWFGTYEGLFGVEKGTYRIKYQFDTNDGIPGRVVYHIMDDGQDLWLGTDNGLCLMHQGTIVGYSFFERDGLSFNEFNSMSGLQASDGKIWMGGLNGINVFDPQELKSISFPKFKLIVNEVEAFDRKKGSARVFSLSGEEYEIKLSPTEQMIQISLSYFSLYYSSENTFSWYLEGEEPEWVNTSNVPLISYRNLSPGSYKVKVKARNFRGTPAENELTLHIEVAQFWYKRWWAVGIWILSGVLIFFLFFKQYVKAKLEKQRLSQLEDLDRQKTNLYTNITHEFRTPLTVILGISERMMQQKDEMFSGIKDNMKVIHRNGTQLLNLVNQMLDITKVEFGKMEVLKEADNLSVFLRQLIQSYQSMGSGKGIDVAFEINLEDGYFLIDKQKIQQVVGNLLSNAVKFSPEHSEVLVKCSVAQGNWLSIEVIDQGPGIPEEDVPYLFDRFHRVQSDFRAHLPGTGIGLALARELALLMGGDLSYKPEKKGGSVFCFLLPLEKANQEAQVSGPSPESLLQNKNDTGTKQEEHIQLDESKPLVLLVEDNVDVIDYLASCLQHTYRILKAENGKKGLDLAIQEVPDLIISDVMMPEMTGFELCKAIKENPITSHIPVMLLTAKADKDSLLEGLREGADAYLSKPFQQEELMLRMENLMALLHRTRQKYSQTIYEIKDNDSRADTEPKTTLDDVFMQQLLEALALKYQDETFSIEDLSQDLLISRSQLFRKIKALTGLSPSVFLRNYRLEKAAVLLKSKQQLSISEIAYAVGFSSPKYFSTLFQQEYGRTPAEFRADAT